MKETEYKIPKISRGWGYLGVMKLIDIHKIIIL